MKIIRIIRLIFAIAVMGSFFIIKNNQANTPTAKVEVNFQP